jgi:hypothetical protein
MDQEASHNELNGSNWIWMDQTGFEWIKLDLNGSKLFKWIKPDLMDQNKFNGSNHIWMDQEASRYEFNGLNWILMD